MSKESLRSIAPHSTAAATSPADGVSPDSMAHDIVPLDAVAQAGLTPPPATPVNITPPPRHAANVQLSDRWSWLWPSVPALLFLALAATIHSTPPPPPAIETAPIADARAVQETVETGVLPSSQTMIVKAKTGSGYGLLKAELQPTSQVTGQAPLSGQIARVLVRPGQFVDVNDRVLELSTGPTSRRASPVEKVQNSAEAAQVAAVHQQEDLNKKMERAKARLYEAQLRVAAARRRLAQARQMVLTLQNGGEVHLPADASHKPKSSEGNTATRPSARQHKATHEATHNAVDDPKLAAQRLALRDAQHDADKAQRAAAQATSKANAARVAAEAGDQKVRLKQSQLDQATAASDKVQDSFESGEAKGSDVATARAAVSNAKAALSEAAAKAADAHQEAEKQQTLAEKLQDEAKHFSSRVALASQKMKLLAKAEPTREAPTATEAPAAANDAPDDNKSGHDSSSGGKSDAAAVAQFVRDAQAESEAAVQNANHIKSEIDDYDNKVHSTTARLDSTSKELEVAQQTVVENNIKQNLSSVRAPASGVVLSVAEIARDVEPGEAIVTIGRTDLLEARFEDYSDAWKSLKKGMLLHAFVKPASAQQTALEPQDEDQQDEAPRTRTKHHRRSASPLTTQHPAKRLTAPATKLVKANPLLPGGAATKIAAGAVAGAKQVTATASGVSTPAVEGTPIMVRLISILPPTQPGRPAVLRVNIYNPRVPSATGRSHRLFYAGMTVMCSLKRPGNHEVVTVPAAAVIPVAGGTGLVAVLKPVAAPPTPPQPATPQQLAALPAPPQLAGQPTTQSPGQPPLPAGTPVATPATPAVGAHRVEWRPVTLGTSDGVHQEVEITDGLASGERIALEPAALHAFELAHGPSATVRLSVS